MYHTALHVLHLCMYSTVTYLKASSGLERVDVLATACPGGAAAAIDHDAAEACPP